VTELEATADESQSGPGPTLRHAREQLGLTDQQAAEQLNLDVGVVTALETDDYPALGAPVFVKGHLRRYGAMLGLPVGELIAAYEHSSAHLEQPSLIPRARIETLPERSAPRWPWVIGGALALALAAAIVAYLSEYGLSLPWRNSAAGGAVDRPVIDAGDAGAQPDVDADAPDASTPAASPASDTSASTFVPPPVPSGHVSVALQFDVDSWVEIYDGSGKAVLYDLGRAGTSRTIAAAAPLSVTLGNASGVTLSVNGRKTALPALPAGQSVARLKIDADGQLH
jgi:cytoskeleton protein RodZ